MNTIKFEKGNALAVAHRGLSGIERENTCAAFIAAANRSYYGIETDIHRTADGRFVVFHDATMTRVAGENIPVEEVTLAALQSIVLLDKDGTKERADLRAPTLENYIQICKKYEKHCVLELKSDFTEEEIARIVKTIEALDYMAGVTFISFYYENLVKIRRMRPEQPVQFLFSEIKDDIIARLITDGMDADVYFAALNKDVIDTLHKAGRKVNCWTVDTKEDAERLVAMGVDYITTNILE